MLYTRGTMKSNSERLKIKGWAKVHQVNDKKTDCNSVRQVDFRLIELQITKEAIYKAKSHNLQQRCNSYKHLFTK